MSYGKISCNDPCPCGSGKKYKKWCWGKDFNWEEDSEGNLFKSIPLPSEMNDILEQQRQKFIEKFGRESGPDDQSTTKIAAGVIMHATAEPIVQRWVATDVITNPKVQKEMQAFFKKHGVKSVAMSDGNIGCPHEEGKDFPVGEDCPFCPFWMGKHGSNQEE